MRENPATMTSPKLCVVDYGMGNVASVVNAFEFLGVEAEVTSSPAALERADAIILPGVGAFGEAMENLHARDLVDALDTAVRGPARKPFLGICLGMQLVAAESSELGQTRGLGWIEGKVRALPADETHVSPHVGWLDIEFNDADPLFARIPQDGCFYFDHSYYLEVAGYTSGVARYGQPFTAVLRADNIFGTQFHPEKSQRNGLKLLRNFVNYCLARRNAEAA